MLSTKQNRLLVQIRLSLSSRAPLSLPFLSLFFVFLSGCADRKIDHGPGATMVAMTVAGATIETSNALETVGGRLVSKLLSTTTWGCTYNASGADSTIESTTFTSPNTISTTNDYHANLFTAPTYINLRAVILRLRKVGGPSGSMFTEIVGVSGSNPSGSALLTSPHTAISSIPSTAASGELMTFTFSSPLALSAGTSYAIVLKPHTDITMDGANNLRWVTNDAAGGGCTFFPIFRDSSDAGGSWGDGSNMSYRRSFFTIQADRHALSAAVSWIAAGISDNTGWDLSTFSFTENSGTAYGGTVTYDIGAGSSSATATYTSTGLSQAAVKALGYLKGRYIYVRANLTVPSPGFDRAVIGDGAIGYY